MVFQKILHGVTRRGRSQDLVLALLDGQARDRSFFKQVDGLEPIAARMTTLTRVVSVVPDEEYTAFMLAVEDRSLGYPRRQEFGTAFITSSEYRALLSAAREIQSVKFPATVFSSAAKEEDDEVEGDVPEAAAVPVAPTGGRKDSPTVLSDVESCVEFFLVAGRKGVTVNRYKGLGEMNPDTLWMTTMDPEHRTLLQVRAEDHAEADQMFTTLMGDQVEPRRKFIEDNALDVRNLDV
jgi:DNA gyrase subunit B